MIKQFTLQRPFAANGGFAVTASVPRDLLQSLGGEVLSFVSEDGKILRPGDSQHEYIRNHGNGAYSLWGKDVYFSASDNTDCNNNGRNYQVILIDFSEGSDLYKRVIESISQNDVRILELADRNSQLNKSLFTNFFRYFNYYTSVFDRHKIALPKSTIELGCGERPYNALRFLMEGVQRCVVNDVTPIDTEFTPEFIWHLRQFVELTMPGSGQKLDRIIIRDSNGTCKIKGLESHDRRPFEDIRVGGSFDFIYSVSVLEHVMKPREVVAMMQRMLKPGGYACHSIDLRDHGDFDNPLNFLRLTEDEYAPKKTENRLRASDWFALFDEMKFKLVECQYNTYKNLVPPEHDYSFEGPGVIWVDDAMRDQFAPPFRNKELGDLSVIGVAVLYQKPF
jgi:SAM-dependent methyltransferase